MNTLQRLLFRLSGAEKARAPAVHFAATAYNAFGSSGMATYPISFPGYADRSNRPTLTTTDGQAQQAMLSPWVYSDVMAIAKEVSTAGLEVYEADTASEEEQEVTGHPLEVLFSQPNLHMSKSYLMQYWTMSLLLRGEAYFFFAPDLGDEPAEIWPVPNGLIQPVPDEIDFISGYAFKPKSDAKPIIIPPKYICYSRLPNPFDPRRGLSPLVAATLGIQTDMATATWNKDFFGRDNGIPSALVTLPKDLSETEFQRVKLAVQAGLFNQRRVEVIRAGDIDIKQFQSSQKDLEFLAGRAFSRAEIDRVFGIPEGYWTASATEANARHAKAVLIENAAWPLLVMLGQDLTAQIMPQFYGEDLLARFEDIRPRNIELDLRELDSQKTYMTVDEVREAQGLEPLGDWRGKLFISQIGPATPLQEPQVQPAVDGQGNNLEDTETGTDDTTDADAGTRALNEDASGDASEDTHDHEDAPAAAKSVGYYADLERWRTKTLKALKKLGNRASEVRFDTVHIDNADSIKAALTHAEDQEAVTEVFAGAAFLKTTPEGLSDTEGSIYRPVSRTLARVGGDIVGRILRGEHVDFDAIGAGLRESMGQQLVEHFLIAFQDLTDEYKVVFEPEAASNAASTWAAQNTTEYIRDITDRTRKVVQAATSKFFSTPGMTRGEVEALLQPVFGASRAETIAITEVTRAAYGATQAYNAQLQAAGFKTMRVWQTLNDDLTCPVCAPLNGLTEDQWGDVEPPAHPRCRCSATIRIIKDEEGA